MASEECNVGEHTFVGYRHDDRHCNGEGGHGKNGGDNGCELHGVGLYSSKELVMKMYVVLDSSGDKRIL